MIEDFEKELQLNDEKVRKETEERLKTSGSMQEVRKAQYKEFAEFIQKNSAKKKGA